MLFVPLLFPGYCPACGFETSIKSGWFCPKCWETHPPGRKGQWLKESSLKRRITVTYAYGGEFRELIHQMKFNGRTDIAEELGHRSATRFAEWRELTDFEIVVPVPLHPVRIRDRGFDQNLVIAEQVANTLNLEIQSNLIFRVKNTKPQARLSDGERKVNIKDAFATVKDQKVKFGRSVLLVDDVIHTGSTVVGSMNALRDLGIENVFVLACCG